MNPAILLVDDNVIQGATRKAILERTGRRVFVAPNGQAALDLFSGAEAQNIGLVVTDHLMPGMNGPELVAEIRRRGLRIPIVVLSGLPDAEAAYRDLDVIFRMKPYPPDSLLTLTHELLGLRMPRTA